MQQAGVQANRGAASYPPSANNHARQVGDKVARTGAAGKITTVECIEGLRTPGSGTVGVLGLDPAGHRGEPRLCLGAQLQDSQLPERLRGGEALKLYIWSSWPADRAITRHNWSWI